MKLTKKQFILKQANIMQRSVEEYLAMNEATYITIIPCTCGTDVCDGWQLKQLPILKKEGK